MFNVPTHEAPLPRAEFDPALLAFVKCHVTSPLKWDVMRVMAEQVGHWISADEIARGLKRDGGTVRRILEALARDGVLDEAHSVGAEDRGFRLRSGEPTTVVLQRLIRTSMESQELRMLIAAHLLRSQHPAAA